MKKIHTHTKHSEKQHWKWLVGMKISNTPFFQTSSSPILSTPPCLWENLTPTPPKISKTQTMVEGPTMLLWLCGPLQIKLLENQQLTSLTPKWRYCWPVPEVGLFLVVSFFLGKFFLVSFPRQK